MAESKETSTMVEKLTKKILPTLGMVVGSFSGLGAVFTAVGYLAERSHLRMLGFTNIPVDLNQYLYSGLHFIGFFLTYIVILGLGTIEKHWIIAILAVTLALCAWLVWHFLLRQKRTPKKVGRKKSFVVPPNLVFLILLVLLLGGQILGLVWLTNVAKIQNLLYENTQYLSCQEPKSSITPSEVLTDKLKYWILTNDKVRLSNFFFKLFCIPLLTAVIIRYLTARYSKNREHKIPLWNAVLLGLNFLLLSTQVIFVPINFGALLLPKQYPAVKVEPKTLTSHKTKSDTSLASSNQTREPGNDKARTAIACDCSYADSVRANDKANRRPLVHNQIRDQILSENSPFGFSRDLNASPVIFTDPDGDSLGYSASISGSESFGVSVDSSSGILNVWYEQAVEGAQASVIVTAYDAKRDSNSTTFNIKYKKEENNEPPGILRINGKIVQVKVPVRDWPYPKIINLDHYFRDDPSDILNYTASSSNTNNVQVTVSGSELSVAPIAAGFDTILVYAYDGKSQSDDPLELRIRVYWPEFKLIAGQQPANINLHCLFSYIDPNDRLSFKMDSRTETGGIARLSLSAAELSVTPVSAGRDTVDICAYGRIGHLNKLHIIIEEYPDWPRDDFLTLLYQKNKDYYLYSPLEKRVHFVDGDDLQSIRFYGLTGIFKN